MNYEAIIHAFVDDLVAEKERILIRTIDDENGKDKTILVITSSEDISRLIGKKGSIASALREIFSIAGKIENKHLHIKFESFDEGNQKGE